VKARNAGCAHGVLVYDDHTGGTLSVDIGGCEFSDNSRAGCKIWRKNGDLTSYVLNLTADDNEQNANGDNGDGIQFEQSGAGDCVILVSNADFSGNGEDDLEIEEADAGNLDVAILGVESIGAVDEGISVFEADAGYLDCEIYTSRVADCSNDAYKIQETGNGTFDLYVQDSDVDDDTDAGTQSSAGDGFKVRPGGAGIATIDFVRCNICDCGDDGVQLDPGEHSFTGVCNLVFDDCVITGNGKDGILAESVHNSSTLDIADVAIDVPNYTNNSDENLDDQGTWTLLGIATDPSINN